MTASLVFLAVLGLGLVAWLAARSKARLLHAGRGSLHSMPAYHGWHVALWVVVARKGDTRVTTPPDPDSNHLPGLI